ncbi:MAG: XRE family transcriptional regulator [Aeromicrobium sp.]|uniref:XRE family transcriptional regulator n=1 Tax=Aeromicrobium sp. TaxID=1871063 RepID=UPI0039E299FB
MTEQTYSVDVRRDGRWWVFDIPELGTGGQARSLAEVAHEAQGVAAMWLDVAPEAVAVDVTVHVEDDLIAQWHEAERDEEEARKAQARAAARRREVVAALREKGYSAPDAGEVLGISRARVYQLSKAS